MAAKSLNDIKEYTPSSFEDERGDIYTVHKDQEGGLRYNHDKVCTRSGGVLVGIHGDFDTNKFVSCLYGRIYCAIVDYRKDSVDYLKHKTFVLSAENKRQLLIPPGFGNSFLVMSDMCVYLYKLGYSGEYTDCDKQFTLRWDDPKLGIYWPIKTPILSQRDAEAKLL